MRSVFLGAFLGVLLSACTTGSGPSLSVYETRVTLAMEGLAPPEGKKFVVLGVEVGNNGGAGLPVAFVQFRLVTSDRLSSAASAQSAFLPQACAQDVMVESGGAVRCEVAFEIGLDLAATQVRFLAADGRTASADVDFPPDCAWCGQDCVDLRSDPSHCGECGLAIADGQICVDGSLACVDPLQNPCPGACDDLGTSRANCGECGRALADNQDCVDGSPVCNVPEEQFCGADCVDVMTNRAHCGSCDSPVPSAQVCLGGYPACPHSNQTFCDPNCANLDTDPANCGRCGNVVPPPRTCVGGQPGCAPGTTFCDNQCVNLRSDERNCGACGRACPAAATCVDGTRCTLPVSTKVEGKSCNTVCIDAGYACEAGIAYYHEAYYSTNCHCWQEDVTCPHVPNSWSSCGCDHLEHLDCTCKVEF